MMSMFKIKRSAAAVLDAMGINRLSLELLNRRYKNNYIRAVNYHYSPDSEIGAFREQLKWYSSHYVNCDLGMLERFLNGELCFSEKPGLIITFDDGFRENYATAFPLLQEYGFTGYYMVSAGLIGKKRYQNENGVHDYIAREELKDLLCHGEVIGCHTFSHHRMCKHDSVQTLQHEIIESKTVLETALNTEISIFCWCGGEEQSYTKEAAEMIVSAGYAYSFMTNSSVILPSSNRYQLDRSNVETSWPLSLIAFQVSGLMDIKMKAKRRRVRAITRV